MSGPEPFGHSIGSTKTFVVSEDDRVAGYFSLTGGQIDTLDAPERVRKSMGQYPVPIVILARLAVSLQDQGRGSASACGRMPSAAQC